MTYTEKSGLSEIAAKVEALDGDVKKLRNEFDEYRTQSINSDAATTVAMTKIENKLDKHVLQEDKQYREQDEKITDIQKSIKSLSEELKEPMEVYKTAKYGAKAATVLVAIVRFVIPGVIGLLVGYNALQVKVFSDIQNKALVQDSQQETRK